MYWDTIWSFKTARFTIALEVRPEEDDPSDSFEFQEDIDFASDGDFAHWFCAKVAVYLDDVEIASDILSGCSYKSLEDFMSDHRCKDPMNRNCSIMREAKGSNVCISHYFPGMVQEAIREARDMLKTTPKMRAA